MIVLKDNTISLFGMCNELTIAIVTINDMLKDYGVDTVITSCNDGTHSSGSLHFIGHAVDIRTWGIQNRLKDIKKRFKQAFPSDEFDFVIEKDHIHLEFQPKKK